jgi:hypothetical protein
MRQFIIDNAQWIFSSKAIELHLAISPFNFTARLRKVAAMSLTF